MNLFDASNLDAAPWPETDEGRASRGYLEMLFRRGAQELFGDRTTFQLASLDDRLIPLAINDGEYGNSNLCSPFARYITHQRTALAQADLPPVKRQLMSRAIQGLGLMLRATQLNTCVSVDVWPLLRNMMSDLSAEQVGRLTQGLVERFPGHAIVYPLLNPATHASLLGHLSAHGYSMYYAPYTRVMLPYGVELNRKVRENRRRDGKLLEASGYRMVDGREVPGCEPRLAELYRMLNREKYKTNPPVSPTYFGDTLRGEKVHYRLAVKDGRVDMFYGFTVKGDVVNSPVAGYDVNLPQELGLYRILNNLLMKEAMDRGLAIETGAGADEFKGLRGDQPVPRYSAVWHRHLPPRRQAGWRLLRRFTNGMLLPAARAGLRRFGDEVGNAFDTIPSTFAPPTPGPAESIARLNAEFDALTRELEQVLSLEPSEQGNQLERLARKLNAWEDPPRRLVVLRARLAQAQQDLHVQRRARRASSRAQRADVAKQLLETATKLGGTPGLDEASLVVHHLGEASSSYVRTLAESMRKTWPQTALLLTATQGEALVLVASTTDPLAHRGLDARRWLAHVAPAPGERCEGDVALAWGEVSPPEDIPAAHEAARNHLRTHLGGG